MYLAGDNEQFSYLSKELYEKAMKDIKFKEKYIDEDVEIFKSRKEQFDYTWHHYKDSG